MLIAGGAQDAPVDRVAEQLGARLVTTFSDVMMHVPVETARAAVSRSRDVEADLLLSLGGGSATGTAKAVALETGLPILAVPTTYAGSEMTPIWGMTENDRKTTGRDPIVLPRAVVYDPELTLGLPIDLSTASGMNAMAHLVEALYAPDISPISSLQSEAGITALARALPRIVDDPTDIEARGEALYGAWLAGWALGTLGMGVHHTVCHVLGGTYGLAHAPVHAAVLSHATAFNEAHAPEAMAIIRNALGQAGIDAPTAASGLYDLEVAIGAPTSLAHVGFDPADIDEAAGLVVAGRPVNPRPVDEAAVRELLASAIEGRRPA